RASTTLSNDGDAALSGSVPLIESHLLESGEQPAAGPARPGTSRWTAAPIGGPGGAATDPPDRPDRPDRPVRPRSGSPVGGGGPDPPGGPGRADTQDVTATGARACFSSTL